MSSKFLPVLPYNNNRGEGGQQKEGGQKEKGVSQNKGQSKSKVKVLKNKKNNSLYPQPTSQQVDMLRIIERLVDDDLRNKDELVQVCGELDRAQFYTLAEERSLAGRCGNPICQKKQPKGIFCGVKCAQQLAGFSRFLEKVREGKQEVEIVQNNQRKATVPQSTKTTSQYLVQPIVQEREGNSQDNELIISEQGQNKVHGTHDAIEGYVPRKQHNKRDAQQQENIQKNSNISNQKKNLSSGNKSRDFSTTNQIKGDQFDADRISPKLHSELKNFGLENNNNSQKQELRTTSLTLENLSEIHEKFQTPTFKYLKSPRNQYQGILKKTMSGTQLPVVKKTGKKVTFGMPTTVRLPPVNDENVRLDAFDEFLKKQKQKMNRSLSEETRKLQEELTQAIATMSVDEDDDDEMCTCPFPQQQANQLTSDILKEIRFKKIQNGPNLDSGPIIEELCSSSDDEDLDDFKPRGQGFGSDIDDNESDSDSEDGDIPFLSGPQGYKADLSTFGNIWAFYGDSLTTSSREWLCSSCDVESVRASGGPKVSSNQTAIKNSFSQMMYGRMSGLMRDLQLKVNRDDIEQCLAVLITTMNFRRPLPGLGSQVWNLVLVGLLCALSKHQLPALRPTFEDENENCLLAQFISRNSDGMDLKEFRALQEQFLLQQ